MLAYKWTKKAQQFILTIIFLGFLKSAWSYNHIRQFHIGERPHSNLLIGGVFFLGGVVVCEILSLSYNQSINHQVRLQRIKDVCMTLDIEIGAWHYEQSDSLKSVTPGWLLETKSNYLCEITKHYLFYSMNLIILYSILLMTETKCKVGWV